MDTVKSVYVGETSLYTAAGNREDTFRALRDGRSGLHFSGLYGMYVGAVPESCRASLLLDGCTFFDSLVIASLREVIGRSGLDPESPGLLFILSTTKGNVDLLEKNGNRLSEEVYLYNSALKAARRMGFANPPVVISNACVSGVSALIVGREMILSGRYRHVIVCGCDVLSRFVTEGFASFRSVGSGPCRPYDKGHDGLTLGEACGAVLLTEDSRYATIPYVRLSGGSVTNDANHISGPSRTGDGLYHAIRNAMEEASMSAEDIGFVNAHGTATVYNDDMESRAVAWAGLDGKPLNSLKGCFGHTLGASGVVEAIVCKQELCDGFIFPTLGFEEPGTPCRINVSASALPFRKRTCVKTASGFGGSNAAVVLSMEEEKSAVCGPLPGKISVVAEYELPQSGLPFGEFIREEFRKLNESNMKFYKMSDLCKAAYVAAANLLKGFMPGDEAASRKTAVVLSGRSSSLEADMEHQRILNDRGREGASPAVFVYTLPNVAIGELCIRHRIRGCNLFFIENEYGPFAEEYCRLMLETGKAERAVCGRCEKFGERWKVGFKLITK